MLSHLFGFLISNSFGEVIFAVTQKHYVSIVLIGEAVAALLATWLAAFTGTKDFMLEGDALLVILVVKQPHLFSSWHFTSFISDIRLCFSCFHS
jgi:hypothetical protein